jgi:UDP-N-acetylglucosamine acyltransferase
MVKIHPMSVVDPKAELDGDVEVGPFCIIGPKVRIGSGSRLISHVVIDNRTTIGRNNTFHPHSVIGGAPQDLSYRGEDTALQIGDGNTFREAVTVNIGTEKGAGIFGDGVTRIGDHNLIMVNVHIAHDCQIGSRNILSNNVGLSGHVVIGSNVAVMGLVGIHQFVTVGDLSYLTGMSRINHDVPPFLKVSSDDQVRALNETGLQRAGFGAEDIEALDHATRKLFFNRKETFAKALAEFDSTNGINPHVKTLVDFLRRRDKGVFGRYLESLRRK